MIGADSLPVLTTKLVAKRRGTEGAADEPASKKARISGKAQNFAADGYKYIATLSNRVRGNLCVMEDYADNAYRRHMSLLCNTSRAALTLWPRSMMIPRKSAFYNSLAM